MVNIKKSLYDKDGVEITGADAPKIDGETDDLTKDDKDVFTLQEVGMFAPTVTAIILETTQTIEGRLAKTLGNQIRDMIQPLKQSRIEYLEQELNVANFIMMEIQETYLGMFLLKRIHKKIRLDAEKKVKKEKAEVVRGTMNLDYPITKEGKTDGNKN